MGGRTLAAALAVLILAIALRSPIGAQENDPLFDALGHPAIAYYTSDTHDPAAELERTLEAGTSHLKYERDTGYLRSLLAALRVPVESQMAVFSKTSLQSPLISPANPRAIYFTDDVAVAWPRGGFIEIASHDPQQGVQFYMLPQQETDTPRLLRADSIRRGMCLNCHQAYATLGVPGMLARSVAAGPDGRILPQLANFITDDRSPMEERWAGWFVTGSTATARHLGNLDAVIGTGGEATTVSHATSIASLADRPNLSGYLTPYSDVAALLVFNHQIHMVNLLTRTAWEARIAEADRGDVQKIARDAARQLVDAMLFVDEAPLSGPIASSSGFAAAFAARGPADPSGRSLRQLDLTTRLMRYPCSFMIYTPAFDRLPATMKGAVYQRLWDVLSGRAADPRYARLSADDRRAIIEILRATKPDLPPFFS